MPFDGRAHGVGNLISPYLHHPNAHAVGEGLATALRHTYAVARKARLLGSTSFPPVFRSSDIETLTPSDWGGLTRFYQVDRPEWATHVLAEVRFFMQQSEGLYVRHRVRVRDGVDVQENLLDEEVGGGEGGAGGLRTISSPLFVPLIGLSGLLDVEVDAFPYSPGGGDAPLYSAESVTAWWLTLE